MAQGTGVESSAGSAPEPTTRRCSRCRLVLPLDSFQVDRGKPLGRRYACRECHLAQLRARRLARASGKPTGRPVVNTTCTVEGCDKPARTRTWCKRHYARWQRWGHPEARKRGADRQTRCKFCGMFTRRTRSGFPLAHPECAKAGGPRRGPLWLAFRRLTRHARAIER